MGTGMNNNMAASEFATASVLAELTSVQRAVVLRRYLARHAPAFNATEVDSMVAELRPAMTPQKFARAVDSMLRIVVVRLLGRIENVAGDE